MLTILANTDWPTTWAGVQGTAAVAALWFALVQVTRDGRAERRRARANIVVAGMAVSSVGKQVRTAFEATGTDLGKIKHHASALLRTSLFPDMIAQLDSVPLISVADPDAIDAIVAARAAVKLSQQECERAAGGDPQPDTFSHPMERLAGIAVRLETAAKKTR
jgi:hypothetical protein